MKAMLYMALSLGLLAAPLSADAFGKSGTVQGNSGSTQEQGYPKSEVKGLEKGSNEGTDMMKGAGVKTEGKTVQQQGPSVQQMEHDATAK